MKAIISAITLMIMLFGAAPSAVATLNSNSIIEDGIEYYIQTDKSTYDLGENVEMLFRITNLRDEDVIISCSQSPEFNFYVQEDGETIWAKVHGFYGHSPGIHLSIGQSVELSHIWDMIDDNDNLVAPGIYNVVGVMYNQPWNYDNHGNPYITEVAVPITIIPEPATLSLLVLGGLFLKKARNNK